jgi:hypothetical protein
VLVAQRSGGSQFKTSLGIVCEILSQKHSSQKKRTGRVAQGVGPEFNPQYCKKKKKGNTIILIILQKRRKEVKKSA